MVRYEILVKNQRRGWTIAYTIILLTFLIFCAALCQTNLFLTVRLAGLSIALSIIGLIYSYWLYRNSYHLIAVK